MNPQVISSSPINLRSVVSRLILQSPHLSWTRTGLNLYWSVIEIQKSVHHKWVFSLKPTLVPGSQASPLSTFSHTVCWGQPGSWYLARLTSSAESRSFRKSMVCSRVSELFSWHCVWDCWGYTWRWHCLVVEVCVCSTMETCGCLCWSRGTRWHPPSVCEVHWLHPLEWLLFHPFHFTYTPRCVVMHTVAVTWASEVKYILMPFLVS